MAQNGAVTVRRARFLAALLETGTVTAAAAAVGVSRRTGGRWLQDADVRSELARLQNTELAAAAAAVVGGMESAAVVLREIAADPMVSPSVRVSASRALLSDGTRLAALVTLAERVNTLEVIYLGGVTDDDF